MRVLLCGGGSAGHVNPALAIGETVLRNSPESKIAYVATVSGIENDLVSYKKYHIEISGLKKDIVGSAKSLLLTFKAIKKSKEIIKDFCPDVIIGTGGYATYPVICAGKRLGIPTIVHESNVVPGKAIKLLENKADLILTNFKESSKYFNRKEKVINVGNPLRNGFVNRIKPQKEKQTILCYGGSLGAEKINEAAIEIADNFIRYQKNIDFILATGKRNYYEVCERIKEKRLDKLENLFVYEYLYDMAEKMAMADVVICRAGAMTLSELSAFGKAAILIPSPNVANNHQVKNAMALEKISAARVVTENKLYLLIDVLRELLTNKEEKNKIEKSISSLYNPNSNKEIYKIILELVKKSRREKLT